MFFPIGDSPNPRNFTPWINWGLIAANVIVYVLITIPLSRQGVDMNNPLLHEYLRVIANSLPPDVTINDVLSKISAYDLYTFSHGYKPGAPKTGDLFFSLFLHGGLLHLAGNMLFLWIYGNNVEFHFGKIAYLATYLLTGAIATLSFALFAGSSMIPLVGASGAISGVLGIYFLLFPRNKIKVFIALIPFYVDVLFMPSRLVLGVFILIDNILPVLIDHQSSVAYGAHIGGFIGGLIIAFVGERFSWHWPWRDTMWKTGSATMKTARATAGSGEETAHLSTIRTALDNNSREAAIDLFSRLDSGEIAELKPTECVTLSRWLDESGHPIAASRLLRQCVVNRQKSEPLAEIYLTLGLMRLNQGQPTAAYQYLLAALESDPSEDTEKQTRDALNRIDIHRSAR